jgi:hypothetical protein
LKGETDRVPNFHILFLLNVNETVPSGFESAVGIFIKPTCPNELKDELYVRLFFGYM